MARKNFTAVELQHWLFEKALEASAPKARKLIAANDQRGRATTVVGKLYLFKYNPKWRHILPRYDKFPLSLAIERYSDGFLGLNLHYLSVGERQALLDELSVFLNNKALNQTTKMLVSYQKIKAMSSTFALAKPCIHRYLWVQCRSKFIEVYPSEFSQAIQLPVEEWVFNP